MIYSTDLRENVSQVVEECGSITEGTRNTKLIEVDGAWSSSQAGRSAETDVSKVAKWVLCGLALVLGGFALTRSPSRMLGVEVSRVLGMGVVGFGLFYGYAVAAHPTTQQLASRIYNLKRR